METRAKDYRAEESCEGKRKMYFRVRYGLCNARTIVQSMLQYKYVEAESYPQHEVGDYIMFLWVPVIYIDEPEMCWNI